MPVYNVVITIYVVENGFIVKNGNPESMVSKQWVAKTTDDLSKIIGEISKQYEFKVVE